MSLKKESKKSWYADLPETPGVYCMMSRDGRVLYVGKAGNLKRRVSSYFLRPHDARIERLVGEIKIIRHMETPTVLEALVKEASLIKRYRPPYNIKEKDDKSFLFVEITREEFPRVLLVRGTEEQNGVRYGPFVSAGEIRQALKIVRRIFPFSIHPPERIGRSERPCLDYELGLCPGACAGFISKKEYGKNIRNIKLFFEGKKEKAIALISKDMQKASKNLEFERAAEMRRTIFSLRHIQDAALLGESGLSDGSTGVRIEGYDISMISGTSAVGSMVVFSGDIPVKKEYRKFKIRTVRGADDTGMLREIVRRRFDRDDWPMPDIVFVDGGKPQVNAARALLREKGIGIPIIGIAKGPTRKKIEFVGTPLADVAALGIAPRTLVRVRDEAHRFAVKYHREVRARESMR